MKNRIKNFKNFNLKESINPIGRREFKTFNQIKDIYSSYDINQYLIINKTYNQKTYLCKTEKNFLIILDDIRQQKPILLFRELLDRFEILTDIPYSKNYGQFFINGQITVFYNKNLINKEKVINFINNSE